MRTLAYTVAAAALVATVAGCAQRTYHRTAYAPGYYTYPTGYYYPARGYTYYRSYPQTAYVYDSHWDYYRNYRGIHPPAENSYPY
jgi:hypothetical protein